MNINSLGPETVDDYFARGLIRDAADLYSLREEQLISPTLADSKSVRKILDSINESRDVPFERVLFAMGIRFVGEIAAKSLARHFGSMDALAEASVEDMLRINGIGNVIAGSVRKFFDDERNKDFVRRLREHGLRMSASREQEQLLSNILAGKGIVISGVFRHHGREEYKSMIERHGGKNLGSISGKTSFVLAGDNMGPAKLEKARKLGVRIMGEDEFLAMLADTGGPDATGEA